MRNSKGRCIIGIVTRNKHVAAKSDKWEFNTSQDTGDAIFFSFSSAILKTQFIIFVSRMPGCINPEWIDTLSHIGRRLFNGSLPSSISFHLGR